MFSTVQHNFEKALSYFRYDSKPSEGLPAEIHKSLENPVLPAESTLQDHRITTKSPSIWHKVASLGMSYLLFSCDSQGLRQDNLQSSLDAIHLVPVSSTTAFSLSLHAIEPWAVPFMVFGGLSFFPDRAHAQSPHTTFLKAFGGPSLDQGNTFIFTPEEDLIVAGSTQSFGMGNKDVLLAKLSKNGSVLWANTLGGASVDIGYELINTPDGDLFVAGNTFDASNYDILLAKYSGNGTLLWTKTFGGSANEQSGGLLSTAEGGVIVAGYTRSSGEGGNDVLLSKFSNNGTLLWANTLGGLENDSCNALTTTPEGDLILTGETNSDMLLAKFSGNGIFLWAKTLGGLGGRDLGTFVTTSNEGDIFVTGFTSVFGAGADDVLLTKFSSNGTFLWANTIGGSGSDRGRALVLTRDGGLTLIGEINNFGAGSDDVLLSKFSSNGTLVWANTLGGAGSDAGYALQATSQGDLIVTGRTSFGERGDNVLLAKLNAQGVIENCSAWQSVTPQVQSIQPMITDVTLNMTVSTPSLALRDANGIFNTTDITTLMNQTTECYVQTSANLTSTPSIETLSSWNSFSSNSETNSQDINSSSREVSSSNMKSSSLTSTKLSFSSPYTQTTPSTIQSSPILSHESTTSRQDTILSITALVYGASYPIIINGQTVGTFYFTGGSGQLDSNNNNTLNIQLDGDIEDGETITLFTIPEGEEPLWQDIILSYESESGCDTTEGVFTTTSEEEHSYQLIFYESDECSRYSVAVKFAAIPVLGGGIL